MSEKEANKSLENYCSTPLGRKIQRNECHTSAGGSSKFFPHSPRFYIHDKDIWTFKATFTANKLRPRGDILTSAFMVPGPHNEPERKNVT